jgi:hypothetical protein
LGESLPREPSPARKIDDEEQCGKERRDRNIDDPLFDTLYGTDDRP